MTKNVNIKTIRTDGGTQQRAALDQGVVDDYAAILDDGTDLPPVRLFFDGTDNWLADGSHRLHAYIARDRASIPADVTEGTQRDAVLYSCGANKAHGLRRTIADKRNAVMVMLQDAEWSKLSNKAIAAHCGVSHTYVNNLHTALHSPAPAQPPSSPAGGTGTPTGGEGGEKKGKGFVMPPAPPAAGNVSPPAAAPATPGSNGGAAEAGEGSAADANAAAAHGESELSTLIAGLQAENAELQAQITAANADDAKAELMKLRRLVELAERRKTELQQTLTEREGELRKLAGSIRRICKAVGEEDPSKVAATVEAFVRHSKVAA